MTSHAAITGVHNTKVGEVAGSTCMSLHTEAALGALNDAGLERGDIDGVLCAYALTETYPMLSSAFCEYLGVDPNFNAGLHAGGGNGIDDGDAGSRAGEFRHVQACALRDRRQPADRNDP